ncbi:MAG: hypothetical protein ACI9NQ_001954 [Paracoccaceae bacterium]|jgi:hypothetical protein
MATSNRQRERQNKIGDQELTLAQLAKEIDDPLHQSLSDLGVVTVRPKLDEQPECSLNFLINEDKISISSPTPSLGPPGIQLERAPLSFPNWRPLGAI